MLKYEHPVGRTILKESLGVVPNLPVRAPEFFKHANFLLVILLRGEGMIQLCV